MELTKIYDNWFSITSLINHVMIGKEMIMVMGVGEKPPGKV